LEEDGDMARRICIVGNSGSGKTHLARRVAERLGLPHVELDAINHRPNWTEAPVPEFRSEVRHALSECVAAHGGWVVDGNYRSRVADVLDPDTYVWLDYPRRVVVPRIVRRTLGRVLLRRELWNGNRERWSSLVKLRPEQNIVLWSLTQHGNYRRKYESARASDALATWVRLRSPKQAEQWLASLAP
jgi:adenylate kinase family enzyme